MGSELVTGSPGKRASDASFIHSTFQTLDESAAREKKSASPGFSMGVSGNFFNNFKKIFIPGTNVPSNDRLNRTLTFCASASVPTREVHHWVSIEVVLENLSGEILSLAALRRSSKESRIRA